MSSISSSSKVGAGGGGDGVRRRPARALGWRRWLAHEHGLGQRLTVRELVFELHVRRGLGLREVAGVLEVSVEAVREHCPPRKEGAALRAPQSEADFAGLRELVGVALWQTVAETFAPEVMVDADAENEKAGPHAPPRLPLVSTRIKALKQIAKLYDLRWKSRTRDSGLVPVPCATREEIAEVVRERSLKFKV
jgi:hypothetical protein